MRTGRSLTVCRSLLPGGGRVSAPGGGGLLKVGGGVEGVCSWRGMVWYPSMHWGRNPPSREQNDKQVQKYYLGHNFVAAGNKYAFQ